MTFWDRIANIYDIAESINGDVYHEMCEITRRLTPTGAKVLDCAAGTGELSLATSENAESVMCTDLSESMLNAAKRKAKLMGADNISFEARNIFDLKDPDNTYDVVIAGNVLHLLVNPQGAVKELYRVLKPGGKLLLPTFTSKNRAKLVLKAYKLMGFDPAAEYSPAEYKKMLEECGLGRVYTKLVKGTIPCCYAVIIKPETEGSSAENTDN